MTWAYEYETQTEDLLDYCSGVTIEAEGGSGLVGGNIAVGFQDGERWEPKTYGPLTIPLKTVIRRRNRNGTVTHGNGEAGHFQQNFNTLKKLFGQPGLKYLLREDPDAGSIRAAFELLGEPQKGEERNVYYWHLRVPSGSWEDQSESSQGPGSPPSVTTGGTRRILDPTIVFAAAGTYTYTNGAGEEFKIIAAAGPTYPVTVSHDNGEWTAVDNASADAAPYVTCEHPAVMVYDPDSALSHTATSNVTISWRNRWA